MGHLADLSAGRPTIRPDVSAQHLESEYIPEEEAVAAPYAVLLMQVCPSCGEDNTDRARFCQACGAPLDVTVSHDVRKTVTVVFTDVVRSTGLGETLDPETLRGMMSRFFAEMTMVLQRHGGTVEKFIGDAIMAVFGLPVLHEDDALRAVRAGLEMLSSLAAINKELERDYGLTIEVRTGINTGEVVAGDTSSRQALVTGDAVNVAARRPGLTSPHAGLDAGRA